MTGKGFVLDGRSTAPLRRKIHAMRERSANLLAAWNEVADWFADQERLQWGSRGARFRTLWPELAPSTLAEKHREGWTGDILVRDRTLERSLTDRPLSVERLHPHEMTLGTNVPYAKFHHRGTRRMPARPLFSVEQVRAEGAITAAVASWIVRGKAEIKTQKLER